MKKGTGRHWEFCIASSKYMCRTRRRNYLICVWYCVRRSSRQIP